MKYTIFLRVKFIFALLLVSCNTQKLAGSPENEIQDSPLPTVPTSSTTISVRIRRLTALQLRNSLIDIFEDPAAPEGNTVIDTINNGFYVDAQNAVVQNLDAQRLLTYSEEVATWAVENHLSKVTSCIEQTTDCRRRYISDFGLRVFRRPLRSEEVDTFEALHITGTSFQDGVQLVLSAMFQSSSFLYRYELGDLTNQSPQLQLTPYELASNLSYFLTDSTPDAVLLQAAAEDRLSTPEDLEREALRLLETDRAKSVLANFVYGWLEIDDLSTALKANGSAVAYGPRVQTAMLKETSSFFQAVFDSDGTLDELLTADYTYINIEMAVYYKIFDVGSDDYVRLDRPYRRLPGILGHASFLTRHSLSEQSSPVQRGYIIRKRLMCESIAPPPDGIDTNIAAPEPGQQQTTRDKYAEHGLNPGCIGCHRLLDPIGFTFENYNELGLRREIQNGITIDATGTIEENTQMSPQERVSVPGSPLPLAGYNDLLDFLVDSDQIEECFARFVSYYAHGVDYVPVNMDEVRKRGSTLKAYFMTVIRSPQFSERVRTAE